MSWDILECFISDYISSQMIAGCREINFTWQGGEPTMLGVDYFRNVVALQQKHCPAGVSVNNSIQTNGTLLDPEWVTFLKDNDFLVGISIDGPKNIHDRYRRDRAGRPTFDVVMRGLELLQSHDVQYNVLTVVHRNNALKPKDVYNFLRRNGVEFIQFIPIVERLTVGGGLASAPDTDTPEGNLRLTKWSVSPKAYGKFLCDVFDLWAKKDVGQIYIQLFDVQLGLRMGMPSSLCTFAKECGPALALEHNGEVFACDHYVYPEYRLGQIPDASLAEMANSEAQLEFGRVKQTSLVRQCRECKYRFACNGGCPKHRFARAKDGEYGLNYLCEAHLQFFRHAGPKLSEMAELLRLGRPAADIMG